MKLWAGRFQKETDTLVNDFNSSIQFDARLYKQDIAGSIAHAQMLGKRPCSPSASGTRASACTPPAPGTTRWRWTPACM